MWELAFIAAGSAVVGVGCYFAGFSKGRGEDGDKYNSSYWKGYYDASDDLAELQQDPIHYELLNVIRDRVMHRLKENK
ncbi:hypothetical protein SEA_CHISANAKITSUNE_98 [Gordonia phage ChisanaKitsune]|uniref:Uncharacterized protein n=1 Tax=Gordonia phage ChisanaKitsune TaxID=2871538 RepID=A0AAE7XGH4_9CAUD|nr:hypothetical protein PQD15_gp098 [Gordonia phage ChisanaKitsune]QZE10889.1 hypothetical protein SEA_CHISANAKITSUNE_98 [Gordonia phage ChisanaKitsune]